MVVRCDQCARRLLEEMPSCPYCGAEQKSRMYRRRTNRWWMVFPTLLLVLVGCAAVLWFVPRLEPVKFALGRRVGIAVQLKDWNRQQPDATSNGNVALAFRKLDHESSPAVSDGASLSMANSGDPSKLGLIVRVSGLVATRREYPDQGFTELTVEDEDTSSMVSFLHNGLDSDAKQGDGVDAAGYLCGVYKGKNGFGADVEQAVVVGGTVTRRKTIAEIAQSALKLSGVTSESDEFSRYVVGTVTNSSSTKFSAVTVNIGLYDDAGAQVGTTADSTSDLAPYARWKFKAMITEDSCRRYKVTGIDAW